MTTYIALLRGINVGGNVLLPMKELAAICESIGFQDVRTHINSGNVVFRSKLPAQTLREKLEQALLKKRGRKIEVVIRTGAELKSVLTKNPFPKAEPAKVGVVFLNDPPPKNYLQDFVNHGPEQVRLGIREIYVHYPEGMGRSKLKLPPMKENGTVRNINTVTRLVEIALKIE